MPLPAKGAAVLSLTGVVDSFRGYSKIEPRSASDIDFGTPQLSGFGPAGQFTAVGHAVGPTFPQPVTVEIPGPRGVDTQVTVTAPASIQLAGDTGNTGSVVVTIPAGQTQAVVSMTGVSGDPTAQLTAATGAMPVTALPLSIHVIDYTAETPALQGISPASATLAGGQRQTFTVSYNLPLQSATAVPLSYSPVDAPFDAPPASLTFPADQLSESFLIKASADASMGSAQVIAGAAGELTASISFTGITTCEPSQIVISQVYGGGGNSGAYFKNDFIELFNKGTTAVDLSGWSVYYASASGSFSSGSSGLTTIPANTPLLQGGHYFLIQEAAGSNLAAAALPTPDATGSLTLSSSGGKVALVAAGASIGGTSGCSGAGAVLADAGIDDLLGVTGASCFEGTAAPASANATALVRAQAGCQDTNRNGDDFVASDPTPRSTTSAATIDGGILDAGPETQCTPACGG